jgi:hypothetical protein
MASGGGRKASAQAAMVPVDDEGKDGEIPHEGIMYFLLWWILHQMLPLDGC